MKMAATERAIRTAFLAENQIQVALRGEFLYNIFRFARNAAG